MPNLQSQRSENSYYIDWWLMNHCSWACSYCHSILRSGSFLLPDIRACKDFIDQIDQQAKSQNKQLDINFTGGEVTEWTDFPELLSYAYGKNAVTRMNTNLNVDLEHWQKIVPYLKYAVTQIHIEHTQLSHFMLIINWTLANTDCDITVNFNMLPDKWSELTDIQNRIKEKWPQISISHRMLFKDPIINSNVMDYDQQQLLSFKQPAGIVVEEDSNTVITSHSGMILDQQNNFYNHECRIGIEQIIVTAEGVVYRGHCRQGGPLGKIGEQIQWPVDSVVCLRPRCANGFDIQATKKSL